MERKRITCPETAHLEEVDLERTPLGIVIGGCSRFEPRCALRCTRECARRMDRRDSREGDDRDRVLVVYAGAKQTLPVSTALAAELAREGITVEQADVDLGAPPPADYDAVVIGTPVRFGRIPRSLRAYLSEHRAGLAELPTFLYVVHRTDEVDPELVRETGWRPTYAIGVARPPWWGRGSSHRMARARQLARLVVDEIPIEHA